MIERNCPYLNYIPSMDSDESQMKCGAVTGWKDCNGKWYDEWPKCSRYKKWTKEWERR